jgi:DNA (cytosine-5)-methyltransferase 1
LLEGLHQAGVAETLLAIETNAIAAEAFYANHPNATVFTGDCNVYLKNF